MLSRVGLILLFWSPIASAQIHWEQIEYANKAFHEVLLTCPDRIWPKMDWSDLQMVFFSKTDQKAWAVSKSSSKGPEVFPYLELPLRALSSTFSFEEIQGKHSVTVIVDQSYGLGPEGLFEFAAHELFHYQGQKNWNYESVGSRGTRVPLEHIPRYYRAMLFDALKEQLTTSKVDLRKAAFWYNKWYSEFPEEVSASTDGYEGTASWVDVSAMILSEIGCSSTDEALNIRVLEWAKGKFLSPNDGLDYEGYTVGALALAVLNRVKTEWHSETVEKGRTPLEILMEGAIAQPQEDDLERMKSYKQSIDSEMSKIGEWLDPLEERLLKPNAIRLYVPHDKVSSQFSVLGFYIPRDFPERTYAPYSRDHHFFNNKTWEIFANQNSVAIYENGPRCDYASEYFVVESFTVREGLVEIMDELVQARFPGKLEEDEEGQFFCPR